MQADFVFKDGIYLVKDSYELDLHNDFDFEDVFYSVAERRVALRWKRSTGEWVRAEAALSVQIEFFEVADFRFFPRDREMPFTEDDCLSEAGYWTDAEWCNGVFISDEPPDQAWLTAFGFMSGAMIAIGAERARAIIQT